MRGSRLRTGSAVSVIATACALLLTSEIRAQTPEEHASHHPGAAGAGAMPAAPGAAPAMGGMPAPGGMMGGGMGEMMDGMMKKMGVPPPKELYPTLMGLPELSPEQRQLVEAQAGERMHAGSALMGHALDSLNTGTQSGDYAAMQEASARLREGIAQMESGIAARRALAEGRAPREVALAWFKREMNLSLGTAPVAQQGWGVKVFHLFTMALLIAFAFAMVAMYFFKMRRAAALFGRVDPDKGPPPPGSAPPLAEGKPPPADNPAPDAPPSGK